MLFIVSRIRYWRCDLSEAAQKQDSPLILYILF